MVRLMPLLLTTITCKAVVIEGPVRPFDAFANRRAGAVT